MKLCIVSFLAYKLTFKEWCKSKFKTSPNLQTTTAKTIKS